MSVSACCGNYIGGGGRLPPRTSGGGGLAERWGHHLDDAATDTAIALVGHRVLPGRHGALWLGEPEVHRAVRPRRQERALVGLAVAHLYRAAQRRRGRGAEPVPSSGGQRHAREQRMIVPLDDDERIAQRVLGGDIPRLLGVPGAAAETQAASLAQGVEGESVVGAELLAVRRFDRPGGARHVALDELSKRPLADEADAGAVRLVEDREPRAPRALADLALLEPAERHEGLRELGGSHRVQEIALVLPGIARLVQLDASRPFDEGRVVPGGEACGAETSRVLKRHAEL